MQRLRELLDAAVDHTSFDLGRAERVGRHVQRSYASRPDEIVSSEQLREILGRHSWHHEESDRARSALATIPDDLLSDMSAHVRLLFRGYIESSTDRIGHAFPIRDGAFTQVTQDAVDPGSIEAVSPVETFAKAIVRGAVVLGAERMMSLVSGWLQGEPVRYWAKAMINGGGILAEPLSPMAGVRIEALPLSTDQLVGYLPRTGGLFLDDYLGRVVLTMDHSAAPALFRHGSGHGKPPPSGRRGRPACRAATWRRSAKPYPLRATRTRTRRSSGWITATSRRSVPQGSRHGLSHISTSDQAADPCPPTSTRARPRCGRFCGIAPMEIRFLERPLGRPLLTKYEVESAEDRRLSGVVFAD